MALNRAVGHGVQADGNVLHMPDDSLQVVDGCSGLWAMARLWVLASLVVALFPTSARQRVLLFVSAVVVGFCVNAVRIAVLAAAVLRGDDGGFVYWHYGNGATIFALGSSAVAGLAWWPTLRRGFQRAGGA
jgi:exosortase/archaeosortase family protein